MRPIILFSAAFPAILISASCRSQQQDSTVSSTDDQTVQSVESSSQDGANVPSQNSFGDDRTLIIDPAPSGNEQAEKSIGSSTGASVTMPGKDAPVSETTQGNETTLDFSVSDPSKASENDTTIIIERQQQQDAAPTLEHQEEPAQDVSPSQQETSDN